MARPRLEAASVVELPLPGFFRFRDSLGIAASKSASCYNEPSGDTEYSAQYWSVRVSANWRITFRFENGAVFDVDLVDYH